MTYLNFKQSSLEEHNFFINIWPLNLDFKWFNIIREPIQIDFSSFIFQFVTSPLANDEPVVLIAAPLIQNWAYTCTYLLQAFGWHETGHIRVAASNATAMAGIKTLALSNGLFYP